MPAPRASPRDALLNPASCSILVRFFGVGYGNVTRVMVVAGHAASVQLLVRWVVDPLGLAASQREKADRTSSTWRPLRANNVSAGMPLLRHRRARNVPYAA